MLELLNIQQNDGFGPEVIVWLIIVVLWIVAQLVARTKQAGRSRPAEPETRPEAPATGEALDRKLRDFFEDLTGESFLEESTGEEAVAPRALEKQPEPPRRDRTAPARTASRAGDWSRAREPSRPKIRTEPERARKKRPSFRTVPSAPLPPPPPSPITHPGRFDPGYHEVDEIDHFKPAPATFSHALIDPRTLMVNLESLRMPIQKVPVKMLASSTMAVPRPPLQTRSDFRKAVLGHIILCPPLAMGEDKSAYTRKYA